VAKGYALRSGNPKLLNFIGIEEAEMFRLAFFVAVPLTLLPQCLESLQYSVQFRLPDGQALLHVNKSLAGLVCWLRARIDRAIEVTPLDIGGTAKAQ
jgi:hypothetical protein